MALEIIVKYLAPIALFQRSAMAQCTGTGAGTCNLGLIATQVDYLKNTGRDLLEPRKIVPFLSPAILRRKLPKRYTDIPLTRNFLRRQLVERFSLGHGQHL